MRPTFKTRLRAMMPSNNYKFAPHSIEVFMHEGRQMRPAETDFISSVQRLPLEGVAYVLCKYAEDEAKLKLVRIAMLFHIYRNDFEPYLKNNKNNPKVKAALDVWKVANDSRPGIFKA